MPRTRQTKGSTSSESLAFARLGTERRAQARTRSRSSVICAIRTKNAGSAQHNAIHACTEERELI